MCHHPLQQDAAPAAKPMPAIMMHALRTLFTLSLLAMAPAHADTPQQRWVGDLPIMGGMTIESELGFAFDSPSGRIVLVLPRQRTARLRFWPIMILRWPALDGRVVAAAGTVVRRA